MHRSSLRKARRKTLVRKLTQSAGSDAKKRVTRRKQSPRRMVWDPMQFLPRSLALLALLPVLASAPACSSSSNNNTATDGGTGAKTCATNADCSSGNEICTSDPGCTDCQFTCHVSCQMDNTCAAGTWCRAEAFSHTAFC